jgi:molybdate transport system substrate-binding protein
LSTQCLACRVSRWLKLLLAAGFLNAWLPAVAVQARDLVVLGEPTLATALGRLGAAWRQRSGVRANVFVAPSDLSFAQIERGARCDVIFALRGPAAQDAERHGTIKVLAGAPILRNALVLVARSDAGKKPRAIDGEEVTSVLAGKRLAIANPDRDLAGAYGRRWLEQFGRHAEGDKNVIVAENAAGVVALLGDNTVELGIVYGTDVAAHPDLAVVMALPEESHPAIEYVAEEAKEPESDTKPFIAFLGSTEAKSILQAAGLKVVGE